MAQIGTMRTYPPPKSSFARQCSEAIPGQILGLLACDYSWFSDVMTDGFRTARFRWLGLIRESAGCQIRRRLWNTACS